ncbi:MAG: amidase [Myxococcota bacterium]|nr:amidase [Myxococcota bacterium]
MDARTETLPDRTVREDPLTWSGTRIARAIREGDKTSEEIVALHLAHLARVNPRINAVVRVRADRALEEARRADATRSTSSAPFAGVPCTIKEAFALEGMPLSAGLVSRREIVSTTNAIAVRRMLDMGAIPLGVTNVSELLMWMESDNRVYGRCNNPYDQSRIAGGSSGGEGAAIAAGIAPFGLGADIGGSIRLPAFFDGVFGHKPTGGLVPNAGQWPMPSGAAMRYLCSGPLARHAEDLWPLMCSLAGPDAESPECAPCELGSPDDVSLDGMRVLHVASNGLNRVHRELVAAQERAALHLESRGARIERVTIPALKRSVLIWSAMMSAAGGDDFSSMLFGGERRSVLPELMKVALGKSAHTLPALVLAAIEAFPKLVPGQTDRLLAEGEALKRELAERIGDGVMLFPTYTRPAPRHAMPMLTPIDWGYTAIINVVELPSTQVPLGLGTEGLPLGCQVIGRHHQDHRTIAVALELERAFGGWVPPALMRR